MFKSYSIHPFILKRILVYLPLLCMLPSCMQSDVTTTQSNEDEQEIIYDLNDSTDIILALLKSGELSNVLKDDVDSDELDTFIKNVSPAWMAFQTEVLYCTLPVLVCYCTHLQMEQCKQWLLQLHEQYPHIKYVVVNEDKLLSVALQSGVKSTPTLLLVKDEETQARFTPPVDLDAVRGALTQI